MGYETFTGASAQGLEEFRSQCPVTQSLVYLNHAAVAPLCRPAADAMKNLAEDVCIHGSVHYKQWLAAYQGLRTAAARLLGGDPGEIAIVKNTSEGISLFAEGLDWRAGDKVVAFQEEFPANYYPWKRLERRGVRVELLSESDSLDRIDEAARGARLVSLSFVQFMSGRRVDLNAIGEICHRRGCLFFVDAIQGLGAFPMDVRAARIHALAADGHKWLLGPEGCGLLYIQRDIQDSVEPVEFGWTNVAGYGDYASRDMTLRPDAGRYECGTLNTIGCFGLHAAMNFILEVGVDRIAAQVQALGDQIYEGVVQRGYDVLVARTPENGAGIVSFRHSSIDARRIVSDLDRKGFSAAPRAGWVRASPHFYISADEIAAFLAELP